MRYVIDDGDGHSLTVTDSALDVTTFTTLATRVAERAGITDQLWSASGDVLTFTSPDIDRLFTAVHADPNVYHRVLMGPMMSASSKLDCVISTLQMVRLEGDDFERYKAAAIPYFADLASNHWNEECTEWAESELDSLYHSTYAYVDPKLVNEIFNEVPPMV